MISQRKCLVASAVGIILLTAIILISVFTLKESNDSTAKSKVTRPNVNNKASVFSKAAVATDAELCSKIGADVLRRNGSAADAAIAAMFCTGVANPHSCGIGGGSFMVYYQRSTKKFMVYDFREMAPQSAFQEMFVNQSKMSKYGGLASAIPGQVKGLWRLHQDHGKLSWSDLIAPSVKLARDGVKILPPVYSAIRAVKDVEQLTPGLKKLLTKPDGVTFLKVGDTLKNPKLAETLEIIQKNPESFYNGTLMAKVIKDINGNGGNVTVTDFKNYTVKKRHTIDLPLTDGDSLHTMSAPGGGAIISMINNIMSGYDLKDVNLTRLDDQVKFYQLVIEAMKFSYAQRGLLGDPDFIPKENITKVYDFATNRTLGQIIRDKKIQLNATHDPPYYGGAWGKEDFGTSHMSIVAENGDAISTTSTVNYLFGNLHCSEDTGIIYNNQMDDFSTPGFSNFYGYPPAPSNFIKPGKRPLSSMAPTIVTDKDGDVKLVVGASGGSRIISGTALVILKTLRLGQDLGKAVSDYRLHHQGIPNEFTYNVKSYAAPKELVEKLIDIGHKSKITTSKSVVQAVYVKNKKVYAMSDPRKHSKPDGY